MRLWPRRKHRVICLDCLAQRTFRSDTDARVWLNLHRHLSHNVPLVRPLKGRSS